ncbi:hypothetical protein GQ44DRAFT_511577 [Phaeosphaeriaceae sp. PMI808]|nr:hypothetical protein GQ44DRAFT_511577 [Phaeosphaeriaceae sp. PMI808]
MLLRELWEVVVVVLLGFDALATVALSFVTDNTPTARNEVTASTAAMIEDVRSQDTLEIRVKNSPSAGAYWASSPCEEAMNAFFESYKISDNITNSMSQTRTFKAAYSKQPFATVVGLKISCYRILNSQRINYNRVYDAQSGPT